MNPEITVAQCQFNAQCFEDGLFGQYGVAYSPTLDNAVVKRRSEFLAGRYAAKQALNHIGAASYEVGIGKDRSPVWPGGVVGSISHTNTQAVCAVASSNRYQAIGIDLENWIPCSQAESLKSSIGSEKEASYLQQLGIPLQEALTIIFSAKESLFKALYPQVGCYFGFDAAELIAIDLPTYELQLMLTGDLTPDLKEGMRFQGHFAMDESTVFTMLSLPVPGVVAG